MSNKNNDMKNYWFRAKRYGWGWGLPLNWQGWIVLITYIGLIVAGTFIFPPEENTVLFIIWTGAFSVIFLAICWIKGESPSWRWGKYKDAQ